MNEFYLHKNIYIQVQMINWIFLCYYFVFFSSEETCFPFSVLVLDHLYSPGRAIL